MPDELVLNPDVNPPKPPFLTYDDLPVKRADTLKLRVEMDVTAPQAYALQQFFRMWNMLGNVGSSRYVAFYCDGDGNFHPNCVITTDPPLPPMPQEQLALCEGNVDRPVIAEYHVDYDAIGWSLHGPPPPRPPQPHTEVLDGPFPDTRPDPTGPT